LRFCAGDAGVVGAGESLVIDIKKRGRVFVWIAQDNEAVAGAIIVGERGAVPVGNLAGAAALNRITLDGARMRVKLAGRTKGAALGK
jgi:hypothetical protein